MPRKGVEPLRLSAQDPKSCVAASYTTSASRHCSNAVATPARGFDPRNFWTVDVTLYVRKTSREA
jgi:hypothetical protein